MFQRAKLREPKFYVLTFDGFNPMEFIESLKAARLGEFHFSVELSYNPTLIFWRKDKPEEKYIMEHGNKLIKTEDNTFFTMSEAEFYKTYQFVEKSY